MSRIAGKKLLPTKIPRSLVEKAVKIANKKISDKLSVELIKVVESNGIFPCWDDCDTAAACKLAERYWEKEPQWYALTTEEQGVCFTLSEFEGKVELADACGDYKRFKLEALTVESLARRLIRIAR